MSKYNEFECTMKCQRAVEKLSYAAVVDCFPGTNATERPVESEYWWDVQYKWKPILPPPASPIPDAGTSLGGFAAAVEVALATVVVATVLLAVVKCIWS